MDEWLQLLQLMQLGSFIGPIGKSMSGLSGNLHLQGTNFSWWVRLLTGFGAHVRTGFYRQGHTVAARTVTSNILAVGQMIAIDTGYNCTKIMGSDKLLPCIQQMIEGFCKVDPPLMKKLPVKVDVPEHLVWDDHSKSASQRQRADGDLMLIAFCYLLCIGEYTVKEACNSFKQTAIQGL